MPGRIDRPRTKVSGGVLLGIEWTSARLNSTAEETLLVRASMFPYSDSQKLKRG